MSELIPNLDGLRAHLPTDENSSYAYEFIAEIETADSVNDIAAKVDALVDRWLEVPNEHDL